MKKLCSLLLVLVMLFTMAGCSKGSESNDIAKGDKTQGDNPIKLTMWTMHTTEAMIDTLNAQVKAFESQNPDIKIKIETLTYDVVYQRMMAGMNSDTMPNIFNGIEGHIAFMQSKDALADVSDIIDAKGGRDAFVEKYLDWVTKEDVVYAVPDWALYQGVWYRKDLFEENNIEIPKTWEELSAAAAKLTQDTDGDGKTDIYGMCIPMDRNMVAQQTYSQFLYSNGVNIFNTDTGAYEFGDKKEEAVQALDTMMQIYHESSPEGSVNWSWTDFRTALAKGEIAMTSEWGAVVAIAAEQNPEMLDNLSVFPFPGQDASTYNQNASFGGAYYMAIGKSTDEKIEASKKFVEFLFETDNVAERANSRPIYALPALKEAFESDTYKNNEMVRKFSKEVNDIFENIIPYEERSGFEAGLTNSAGQIESSNLMGDAIQNVVLNGWTTQEAVDYMDEKLQEIITNCKEMK